MKYVTILGQRYEIQGKDLLRHNMISELEYGSRIIYVDNTMHDDAMREAAVFELFSVISMALLTENQLTTEQKKALTAAYRTIEWSDTPGQDSGELGLLRSRATQPKEAEPSPNGPPDSSSTTQMPLPLFQTRPMGE